MLMLDILMNDHISTRVIMHVAFFSTWSIFASYDRPSMTLDTPNPSLLPLLLTDPPDSLAANDQYHEGRHLFSPYHH